MLKDINHCQLNTILRTYKQHMTCATEQNNLKINLFLWFSVLTNLCPLIRKDIKSLINSEKPAFHTGDPLEESLSPENCVMSSGKLKLTVE